MLKCDDCGRNVFVNVKNCPYCECSLRPEFKNRVKEEIKPSKFMFIVAMVFAVVTLALCYGIFYAQSHYSWDEDKYSNVVDKDDNEYTTMVPIRTGEITTYVLVFHDDNWIYCADGYKEKVSQSKYDSTSVGDSWSYVETHYDWKPGMENAPIPVWVYVIPVVALTGFVTIYALKIVYLRQKEMTKFNSFKDGEIKAIKIK